MVAGRGRQRPASAATQRSSRSAGQLGGAHGVASTWGGKSQKAWVSKAGRDRGFTNNPAASLAARTIKEKGLATAMTPARAVASAGPASSTSAAPARARDREALPGGAPATAPRASAAHGSAAASAPAARASKSASRWQGLRVSTTSQRTGSGGPSSGGKTPMSAASYVASATTSRGLLAGDPRRVLLTLCVCGGPQPGHLVTRTGTA